MFFTDSSAVRARPSTEIDRDELLANCSKPRSAGRSCYRFVNRWRNCSTRCLFFGSRTALCALRSASGPEDFAAAGRRGHPRWRLEALKVSSYRADDEGVRRRRAFVLGLTLLAFGTFVAVTLVHKQHARSAPSKVAPASTVTSTTYCIDSTVGGHTYRWSTDKQNMILGRCP